MIELLDEVLQFFVGQADRANDCGVLPNDAGERFATETGRHGFSRLREQVEVTAEVWVTSAVAVRNEVSESARKFGKY